MKRILQLLLCIFKSKKFYSIKKKKIVIFDCVNSEILKKILPSNQTYVLSARHEKIKKLLINFELISFLIKNLFVRKMQLNYFISIINQIKPKFVITTIDNSFTFSWLTKHFENKIKFIAVQNAMRGGLYDSKEDHKRLYFSNYLGFSLFDKELLKKKNITIKNYFSIGSIRNSYFKNFIFSKKIKKKYDICLVGKNITNKKIFNSKKTTKATLKLLKFLSHYIKKYKKKIIIQSKSATYNKLEFELYNKLFNNTDYKIIWRNTPKLNSYKNISLSKLVVGAPSTLLREASTFSNTKILCFETRKKNNGHPFSGINHINNVTYKKFEKRLNILFKLKYKDYLKKLDYQNDYLMSKENTVKFIQSFLAKTQRKNI